MFFLNQFTKNLILLGNIQKKLQIPASKCFKISTKKLEYNEEIYYEKIK